MKVISKTSPARSRIEVGQLEPSPELVAEADQAFIEESAGRECLRRTPVDDGRLMTVLEKFEIESWIYEAIESRFDAMYRNLMFDVEYFPEELVGGYPLSGYHDGLDGRMKTVLCLKHMARLPDARILELKWDTFTLP